MSADERYNPITPPQARHSRHEGCRGEAGRMYGSMVAWLTPEEEGVIRQAWADGATQGEMSWMSGVSIDRIRARMKDQLADLPKRDRRHGYDRRPEPPSPAEIAAEAAMLRAAWPASRWLSSNPDDESVSARHLEARDDWR